MNAGEQATRPFKAPQHYDVVVVGAGIHGASIACEASSRGLKTLLVQSGNLGGTASCSPADVVGAGLNLLENLHFPDVIANRDALNILYQKAPHLVRPINAYIVQAPQLRSVKKVNIGAKIYNRLQKVKTDDLEEVDKMRAGAESKGYLLHHGFKDEVLSQIPVREYSINYTRIVIALAQQLHKDENSLTLSHHKLIHAEREIGSWRLKIEDQRSKQEVFYQTNILINCTGCHSNNLLKDVLNAPSRSSAARLNSAYIYVNYEQNWRSAAVFQRENKSLVYAQNFDNRHLCIGPIIADSDDKKDKERAINELLSLWNQNAHKALNKEDIIHCQWSSHPMAEDPSLQKLDSTNTTLLDLNNPGNVAPLLNLFGNNLVQFRKIAEQALDILVVFTHAKRNPAYINEALPGGNFEGQTIEDVSQQLIRHYDFLDGETVNRLLLTYGSNAIQVLDNCHSVADMGLHFGEGLYQREVDYLRKKEWAETAEDILWRRTYLGLKLSLGQRQGLVEYLAR